MNSPSDKKLTGLNGWFIIEILSFYGYIISAIAFMIMKVFKGSLGLDKKVKEHPSIKEAYKYDFIAFYRKDIDWLAFVTILFSVNISLILIDQYIIFIPTNKSIDLSKSTFALNHVQYLLLMNHLLQMIFLRDFYDDERRVNTSHYWVWYIHLISYLYAGYAYYLTDMVKRESSGSTKMWIPLDMILTVNISLY